MKKRINRHGRFELAVERMTKETDIQAMIASSRVSRFIHKTTLLARQRQAINYSHKFVITDIDVARNKDTKNCCLKKDIKTSASARLFDENRIAKVLDGFDPEKSEPDRRILYEVMGMRLDREEFRDEDSSDS